MAHLEQPFSQLGTFGQNMLAVPQLLAKILLGVKETRGV